MSGWEDAEKEAREDYYRDPPEPENPLDELSPEERASVRPPRRAWRRPPVRREDFYAGDRDEKDDAPF